MKVKVNKTKQFISINFCGIEYKKVYKLLKFLQINCVSVFVQNGYKYKQREILCIENFETFIKRIGEDVVIFDGELNDCKMDKEMEKLSERKILIDYNFGENETLIIINLSNIKFLEKDIIECVR